MFRYNLKKRIRGFKLEVAYFLKRARTAIKYGKIGWNITDWDYRSLLELEKTNLEEIYEYYKDLIGVTRNAKWIASKIATLISVINILLEIYPSAAYVNTRNKDLYLTSETSKCYSMFEETSPGPHDEKWNELYLRKEKAWKVYFEMKKMYMKEFGIM